MDPVLTAACSRAPLLWRVRGGLASLRDSGDVTPALPLVRGVAAGWLHDNLHPASPPEDCLQARGAGRLTLAGQGLLRQRACHSGRAAALRLGSRCHHGRAHCAVADGGAPVLAKAPPRIRLRLPRWSLHGDEHEHQDQKGRSPGWREGRATSPLQESHRSRLLGFTLLERLPRGGIPLSGELRGFRRTHAGALVMPPHE